MDNNKNDQQVPLPQPAPVQLTPPTQLPPTQPAPAPYQFAQLPDTSLEPAVTAEQHNSSWPNKLVTLLIIQVLGIGFLLYSILGALFPFLMQPASQMFSGLTFYFLVFPALLIAAIINVVMLLFYLTKQKPRGKNAALSTVSFLISLAILAVTVYYVYGATIYPRQLSERSSEKSAQLDREFAAMNAKPEITKDEAIELLETCKLKGFYYTAQNEPKGSRDGGWGESSSTGVVLTKVDNEPYRISIADRLIPELVPVAREAQNNCGGPQFWHDGSYEQFKDGAWYFGDTVAYTPQTGDSKDEALQYLQSCKADYVVGYTDINLVSDSNTRSWLDKAEKSSTGIAISEGMPTAYVFLSKAMTTELQDTARQIRADCYATKKLYIAVDNWIETEYPQGQWTKVDQ
jgi:hypothetical protein